MKIAIIGAGVSGLTAAYRLQPKHEITLYEANDYLGGHANTVEVDWQGERQVIDTGFIVFNDWTYPKFIELLDELQISSHETSMSFSVRCDAANLEYNGSSLNGLFAQRRNLLRPSFYRMIRDILRFNRDAPELVLKSPALDETPVCEFLSRHRYSHEFADHYLLPMGAAIWSCPLGTFAQFPIRFIIEFFQNHGLLSVRHRPTWRTINGGSREYVARMAKRFSDRVRLSTPIRKVQRSASEVIVTPAHGSPEHFDHVVFACHSDQALRMLDDPTANEQAVLAEFPYERNIAVLHTDEAVLPKRRRAWASWNYRLTGHSSQPAATVTYQMNMLQHLQSQQTYNVTLNSEADVDPAKVLRRFEYHHPIFTVKRAAAQSRHRELLDVNRSSFCGAYWGNGFHEDGVVSALRVCDALLSGETAP